jgi:hypothetical protein
MRRLLSLLVLTALVTTPVVAQQGQQTPGVVVAPTPAPPGLAQATTPPAQAPRAETPRAPSIQSPQSGINYMPAHTNIRLDLAITDTLSGAPVKKTVSLIVLTNNSGMIRTTSGDRNSNLNVDALAAAYTSGHVSVRMTFEYTPPQPLKDGVAVGRSPSLNESITVVLQDGKPMMVSQSADPATDRKVTAELTATILK